MANKKVAHPQDRPRKRWLKIVLWAATASLLVAISLYWATIFEYLTLRGNEGFVAEIYVEDSRPEAPHAQLTPLANRAVSWRSVGPLVKNDCNYRSFFSAEIGNGLTEIREDIVRLYPKLDYAGHYCFEALEANGQYHYHGIHLSRDELRRNLFYNWPWPARVIETDYNWGFIQPGGQKEQQLHHQHLDEYFQVNLRPAEGFMETSIEVPPRLVLEGYPEVFYSLKDSRLSYLTVSQPAKCQRGLFDERNADIPDFYYLNNPSTTSFLPLTLADEGRYPCLLVKIKGSIGGTWNYRDIHPDKIFVANQPIEFEKDYSGRPIFDRTPDGYQTAQITDTNYDFGWKQFNNDRAYRRHLDEYLQLYYRDWRPGEGLHNLLLRFERPANLVSLSPPDRLNDNLHIDAVDFKTLHYVLVDQPEQCQRQQFKKASTSLKLDNRSLVSLPRLESKTARYYCLRLDFRVSIKMSFDVEEAYRIFVIPIRNP